jgi:hypothetical protein
MIYIHKLNFKNKKKLLILPNNELFGEEGIIEGALR